MERIVIDTHSPEPSYQQPARQLRDLITSGQIAPREPLPSITTLVQETGLAVGTVRRAVDVLVQGGYAYTVPGAARSRRSGTGDACPGAETPRQA